MENNPFFWPNYLELESESFTLVRLIILVRYYAPPAPFIQYGFKYNTFLFLLLK